MSFAPLEIQELLTDNYQKLRTGLYGDRDLSPEQIVSLRRKAEKRTRRLVNDDRAWQMFVIDERRRDGLSRPESKRAGMSSDPEHREVSRSVTRKAKKAIADSFAGFPPTVQ